MARIRQVDVTEMDQPRTGRSAAQELTPAARERQRQQRQFTQLMGRLTDTGTVFEVRLGKDEKPLTVRQRLLRAASEARKEIAVRKSENGFYVGLMTPERRSKRGRRKASAA